MAAAGSRSAFLATSTVRESLEEGSLQEKLQGEIVTLARSYGGPIFEPHVTLVPGYEASDKAAAIEAAKDVAASLREYKIAFSRCSFGSHFFQCVYLLCEQSEDVMKANKIAQQKLGLDPGATYMPHLSLLYSNMDQKEREGIASTECQDLFQNDAIVSGFGVTSLTVWATETEDHTLQSWKKLADLPFP